MITEKITELAVFILDTTGYSGPVMLMALESMIAPVPSEAVMPFVGFQVAEGKWNLWAAIFATSLGSIIGSLLSYWMGLLVSGTKLREHWPTVQKYSHQADIVVVAGAAAVLIWFVYSRWPGKGVDARDLK